MTPRTSDSCHRPFLYSRVCFILVGMPLWPWLDFEWWLCNSYSRRKLVRARNVGVFSLGNVVESPVYGSSNILRVRRRSVARTCPCAKPERLKSLFDYWHLPAEAAPSAEVSLAGVFLSWQPAGITHCWHRLSHSLFIYSCWYCPADM